MVLRSTQPLTEMSTRNISWGKGGRGVRLPTLPPSCAVVIKSGNLNFLEDSGSIQACNGTDLPFTLHRCAVILLLYTTDFIYLHTMAVFAAIACFLSLAYFPVCRIGNSMLIKFMVVSCFVIRNEIELFLLLMSSYKFVITYPSIFITFQPVRSINSPSVVGVLYCLM
jgi:hypothetical protein